MKASSHPRLQYGCGLSAPPSWRNFDSSPTLRLQRLPGSGGLFRRLTNPTFPRNIEVGDIVKGLPAAEQAYEAIYCSHVLEHLSLEDCRIALRNTYSYLKPGGIFRLLVPDLRVMATRYLQSTEPLAAQAFLRDTLLGQETRPRGAEAVFRQILGNSRHLWMWDFESMAFELRAVGFTSIRRASYGDAEDPHFMDVEDASRWRDSVGLECRRAAA